MEGVRPHELRVETLQKMEVPRNALIAGTGIRDMTTTKNAYQLRCSDSRSFLILPGTSDLFLHGRDVLISDTTAYRNLQQAKRNATQSIELADTTAPNNASGQASIDPYAIAPGIVVIPASTLGRKIFMVYVRMADQREFLFTGDVSPLQANWREMKVPARLALQRKPLEWRTELHEWLGTINALSHAAPDMVIVSGYDMEEIPFTKGRFSD